MEFIIHFLSLNQLYLLYLIGVMICVGLIKDHNLFAGLYGWLIRRVKSKRLLVSIISAIAGVLPVPGRVVVSAGVLDTIAVRERRQRSKFGLVDYLSTHHYYLWSPLEKTIIIPMAALGLSYPQMLMYTWPLLLGFLIYTFWYIHCVLKEEDVKIESHYHDKPFTLAWLPLVVGIIAMICGAAPWLVFTIVPIMYVIGTKTWDFKKMWSYINWKLVGLVSLIIAASSYLDMHGQTYVNMLQSYADTHSLSGTHGFLLLSGAAWVIAFLLGSSAKFASVVALLTSMFGLPYLTYFMAIEFIGYLVSPCHKCIAIAKEYFGTSIGEFVQVIGGLCLIILLIGLITLL